MNISNVKKFIKGNIYLIAIFLFSSIHFMVALKLNQFRYNNYDFGKFDLGNMTQMVWYTLRGRFMYLTDYFGSNVPRWSMSHVDPLIVLFAPIFAIIPHPLTLVFSQLFIVVFASFLIYLIADLELKSKFSACLISFAYLLNPSIGFINGTMGFHAVTAAIPFFLGAFYLFEKMHKENSFTKRNIIIFWVLLILTMAGKEQVPLYILMWGIFILLFRTPGAGVLKFNKEWFSSFIKLKTAKIGLSMVFVGFAWFITAFFIIIPRNAHYRVDSYNKFLDSIGVEIEAGSDVTRENYFLGRYAQFGESYTEIIFNMVTNPDRLIRIFFGGDRLDSLDRTFKPVSYLPLINPAMLLISLPDFLMNYLVTESGLGVENIENHRISMIIPVLFVSSIYAIGILKGIFEELLPKLKKYKKVPVIGLSFILLFSSFDTTVKYNNPMYLWFTQAIMRRVSAVYDKSGKELSKLEVGEVVRLPDLDIKDVQCADAIIDLIPKNASVSGPDNLGDRMSMRETYAIFPALWNEADYVIVDVQSRKLLTILNLNTNIIKDLTESLISTEQYDLIMACGNLYLFKQGDPRDRSSLLPIQERYQYDEKHNFNILDLLEIVDFETPEKVEREKLYDGKIVYKKSTNDGMDGFLIYMTFVNQNTGEIFQVANLPSFSILRPYQWTKNFYYIENIDIALPSYVDPGDYYLFLSLSNKIKMRSMYLGNVFVE
ncbi:DUF2079 domain-containing protein [Patescibacteria group bacterium]|nr:DUF2079 domain-containing protein [Patescibacteria group bacterium]